MSHSIRLVLALHNHQPIGNFDSVVEQAYQDSYLPFLKTFARYPGLRISLHLSGSLFDWLSARHPDYLDAVADLAHAGRVEILGGAYYEPILPMLPRRDRRGQLSSFSDALERRIGEAPLGAWLSERVWEQTLASDLAACGIEHTVLDDFHFKHVGLPEDRLHGYYLTEDDGRLLAVFPGSEQLRYLIPFAPPEQTIEHLRRIAQTGPNRVVVYGDDGEKFGAWPGMKEHVFDRYWLVRFFDALTANADWLHTTTLAEAVNHVPPQGKIYLPDGSYREMTEWASLGELPPATEGGLAISGTTPPPSAPQPAPGFWRNFKVKYPEADEMYSRMLAVSNRLQAAVKADHDAELLELARKELYRGQCNCGYWHGTYGGVYLPHLRQAVYRHLIAADNLLDRAAHRREPWMEAAIEDFNLDVHKEVRIANNQLIAWIAPQRGGQLYGLDVRTICHNLLATCSRRPETYHRQLLPGWNTGDRRSLACKQAGLEQRLQYDAYGRKGLIDHFFDHDVTLAEVAAGEARERGDFVDGRYDAKVRREDHSIRVHLVRQGQVLNHAVRIAKCVTLSAEGSTIEIDYSLQGLPVDRTLHFAVEFNFALPAERADRYFRGATRKPIGHLGQELDLVDLRNIALVDEHLGLDVGLDFSRASSLWTFPIRTVNRSEQGLELVHQSVCVVPHWQVRADARGCWNVTISLPLDAFQAERRLQGLAGNRNADLGTAEMARALVSERPRSLIRAA